MANGYRGEISAEFDGRAFTLCLPLGALAELETVFGESDMVALATRFENGRISALEAQRIIGAGLRGGGNDISDEMVAHMKVENGAAGYVDAVARLLQATFGGAVAGAVTGANAEGARGANNFIEPSEEGGSPAPFRGTTS